MGPNSVFELPPKSSSVPGMYGPPSCRHPLLPATAALIQARAEERIEGRALWRVDATLSRILVRGVRQMPLAYRGRGVLDAWQVGFESNAAEIELVTCGVGEI